MDIDELLESVDLVELISNYVELEEKDGEYWGLSPFKDEKTPSFSIRRETGRFFDFSSGIGGTAITFLKNYHRISTGDAIEMLKKRAEISNEITTRQKFEACSAAKKFLVKNKHTKTSKSTALPDNCMDKYLIKPDKMKVWADEGISMASMERFQVRYDDFSNRLVYPIRNPNGQIVNIGGRTLVPDWKERKLRKYTYFYPWGELKTIYGLAENLQYIKERKEIIIFEGAKSVLVADTWGIRNAGAILTSHLNVNQMKLLAKLGCDVVFALDKEIKIKEDHNIKRLKQYVNVFYLWDKDCLLDAKDSPVDKGVEVWKKLYGAKLLWK